MSEIDENLVRRLQARDPHAMAELYDRYGATVYRVILRMATNESVAEDLTQEAFLRIWNGIRGFDGNRGSLPAWMVAVARNTTVDYLRSPGARTARTTVELQEVDGLKKSSMFDDWMARFDCARILRPGMEKLTASQRAVVDLAYVQGMSHAEIARSLNRPLGTVKTWLRSALRVLKADSATKPISTTTSLCLARSPR